MADPAPPRPLWRDPARWSERAWWAALTLAVAGLTLRAFGASLGWGFTDADAWADVAYARFPLPQQLLVELTGGVAGSDANFWRPAVMIQFWLTRLAFAWDPAGWHAVNLVEHAVASLCAGAYVAAQARFEGRPHRAITTLTVLLFAAHPLTEEVVPAVARAIDLLLGVASFGAMAALVAWQRRRRDGRPAAAAELAFVALVALALGAKELAVLLLPLAVGWVLLFRGDLGRRRLIEAARVGAPVALLVGAYLATRAHVIGGVGGYYAGESVRLDWLVEAIARSPLEPFVPSLSGPLAGIPHPAAIVPALGIWALVAIAAARSPHRRGALVGAGWFCAATLIFALTGTSGRRVYYVPTLGGLMVIVPAMLYAIERRASGAARLGLVIAAAWLATFGHGSPVFARYPDWREVAIASDVWLDLAPWKALPRGARVWLADRAASVDLDPRRFRLWSTTPRSLGLAHGVTAYSVQAMLAERLPDQHLHVATLTGYALTRPVAEQVVTTKIDGDTLVIHHAGGLRKRWDNESPFSLEYGDEDLRVTPKREGLEREIVMMWTPTGPITWVPGSARTVGP